MERHSRFNQEGQEVYPTPDSRLWSLLPAAAKGSLPRAATTYTFLWPRNARCNVRGRTLLGQRQRGCFKLVTVCALCSAGLKGEGPQKQDMPVEVKPSQTMPRLDMYEQGSITFMNRLKSTSTSHGVTADLHCVTDSRIHTGYPCAYSVRANVSNQRTQTAPTAH